MIILFAVFGLMVGYLWGLPQSTVQQEIKISALIAVILLSLVFTIAGSIDAEPRTPEKVQTTK